MDRRSWLDLPAARQAAAAGRYGTVLRLARIAAGLTLQRAGKLAGYSAATLSRLETGRRPLSDVTVLRRLAEVFDIPPGLFGLADAVGAPTVQVPAALDRVAGAGPQGGGEELVRRREVLAGLAAAPLLGIVDSPAPAAPADPAAALAASLEDLLLRRRLSTDAPVELDALRNGLAATKADFQACRYRALADRLPALVAAAEASTSIDPLAGAVLAEIYNTAAHILIKLDVPGLGWIAAGRAMNAAHASGDPAAVASVTRNVVSLCRRERRYDSARQFALDAAAQLDTAGRDPDPVHLSLHGILLCNAGYAAAQAGDRDASRDLLDQAAASAARLGRDGNAHWTAFGPTNVILHRVSAALALGDAGTAIAHAGAVPAGAIRIPERQARYWLDVARAYQRWGKPAKSYRALTLAEHVAPEEIHARPAVRALTVQLLAAPTQPGLAGVRDLAARLGVAER